MHLFLQVLEPYYLALDDLWNRLQTVNELITDTEVRSSQPIAQHVSGRQVSNMHSALSLTLNTALSTYAEGSAQMVCCVWRVTKEPSARHTRIAEGWSSQHLCSRAQEFIDLELDSYRNNIVRVRGAYERTTFL